MVEVLVRTAGYQRGWCAQDSVKGSSRTAMLAGGDSECSVQLPGFSDARRNATEPSSVHSTTRHYSACCRGIRRPRRVGWDSIIAGPSNTPEDLTPHLCGSRTPWPPIENNTLSPPMPFARSAFRSAEGSRSSAVEICGPDFIEGQAPVLTKAVEPSEPLDPEVHLRALKNVLVAKSLLHALTKLPDFATAQQIADIIGTSRIARMQGP